MLAGFGRLTGLQARIHRIGTLPMEKGLGRFGILVFFLHHQRQ